MTRLVSGSATDVGRVRTSNQDLALEDETLFAVADGMGGHAGGEVAARTAVDALREAFRSGVPSTAALADAVRRANHAVWAKARAEASLRGMGTTLTALALVREHDEDRLALVNVGDSRAYLLHGERLTQVTDDHSLVEEMVRSGELTAEEAAVHPSRHILTRALGVEPEVDVDVWQVPARPGDRVLLCSDGLINEVSDEEIARVLAEELEPKAAALRLVATARAHGGSDNITAVVINVVEGEADPRRSGAAVTETPAKAPRGRRRGAQAGAPGPNALASAPATSFAPRPPPPKTASPGLSLLPEEPASRPGPPLPASGPARGEPAPAERSELAASPRRSLEAQRGPLASARREAAPVVSEQVSGSFEQARVSVEPEAFGRALTPRVAVFSVLLLAVVGAAVAAVWWYAEDSYYVGLDGTHVAIYRGRPGGLLWFHPRLVERTGLELAQVLPARVPDLRAGEEEPSLAAARRYVSNLRAEAAAARAAGSGASAPSPLRGSPQGGNPAGSTTTTSGAPSGTGALGPTRGPGAPAGRAVPGAGV